MKTLNEISIYLTSEEVEEVVDQYIEKLMRIKGYELQSGIRDQPYPDVKFTGRQIKKAPPEDEA